MKLQELVGFLFVLINPLFPPLALCNAESVNRNTSTIWDIFATHLFPIFFEEVHTEISLHLNVVRIFLAYIEIFSSTSSALPKCIFVFEGKVWIGFYDVKRLLCISNPLQNVHNSNSFKLILAITLRLQREPLIKLPRQPPRGETSTWLPMGLVDINLMLPAHEEPTDTYFRQVATTSITHE
ncbi:hypothetical protein BDF20DRAFT_834196 [Mycotypha africana]|uniref:uncharacterized protein n=1 Tax=Mycotypha africana TaxID=64632 RepID=UPI0023002973|nr:uncharacterized protein BDF20DRAFT_834196 [Mycotypha africana]KAI8984706.1 hypothetical protein BDF20DRAFT_834196 [Mycotypha africana]